MTEILQQRIFQPTIGDVSLSVVRKEDDDAQRPALKPRGNKRRHHISLNYRNVAAVLKYVNKITKI